MYYQVVQNFLSKQITFMIIHLIWDFRPNQNGNVALVYMLFLLSHCPIQPRYPFFYVPSKTENKNSLSLFFLCSSCTSTYILPFRWWWCSWHRKALDEAPDINTHCAKEGKTMLSHHYLNAMPSLFHCYLEG